MLLSRARSARMACWVSAFERLSSSRSSTPNPGPNLTSVAPSNPPSKTVSRIRRAWRSKRETTIRRLPGARGLKYEPARRHHAQLLFLFRDIHAPVCLAEQPVGIRAILGKHRMADAQRNGLLSEDFAAGVLRDGLQSLDLLLQLVRLQARQHQHELVATHARHVVVLAAAFLQLIGHRMQQPVALQVAVPVV